MRWFLREHKCYAAYNPDITFTKADATRVQLYSTAGSLGNGIILKNFQRTRLNGKKLRITWSSNAGYSYWAFIYIYDGLYDETQQAIETFKQPRTLSRSKLELEQATENMKWPRRLCRVKSENETSSEASKRLLGLLRMKAETLQISASRYYAKGLVRWVIETLQLAEISTTIEGIIRSFTESIALEEAEKFVRFLTRLKAEIVSTTETPPHFVRALVQASGENLTVCENKVKILRLFRKTAEFVQLPETASRRVGILKIIAETVAVAEIGLFIRGLIRLVGEIEAIQEAESLARERARALGEQVSVIESKERPRALNRFKAESIYSIGDIRRCRGLVRLQTETVEIRQTKSKAKAIWKVANESLHFIELLKRLVIAIGVFRKYPPTLTTAVWNAAIDFLGGFTSHPSITTPKVLESGSTRYLFQNKDQNVNVTTTVVVSLMVLEPDTGYIVILQNVGGSQAVLRITTKTMSSFTVSTDAATAFDWVLIR